MCYCNPWCYITAGILTIVQCFFHWLVCIWMILVYTCQFSMLGKSYLLTLWYFTYFYRSQCTNATTASFVRTLTIVINKDIEELYDFSSSAPLASMTYFVAVAYAVLDLVWIGSAIFLIVGIFNGSLRYKVRSIQLPWMICCLIICLLDITAVGIYGSHISQTDTLHEWITFSGGKINDKVDSSAHVIVTDMKGRDLVIPSIIMTAFFARLIFIWFVNVTMFLIFVVLTYVRCSREDFCTCESQPVPVEPLVMHVVRDAFCRFVLGKNNNNYDDCDNCVCYDNYP